MPPRRRAAKEFGVQTASIRAWGGGGGGG